MIKNEREYRITKARVASFAETLDSTIKQPVDEDISPRIRQAEEDAVKYQIADLNRQLKEYESLRSTQSRVLRLESLVELPDALIKGRIAAGLTQKELAEKLNLKEQQIQRYESLGYTGASLGRLVDVLDALSIKILLQMIVGKQIEQADFDSVEPIYSNSLCT